VSLHITYDGRVLPCAVLYDFEVGNVYQMPLKALVENNAGKVCYDFEVKGPGERVGVRVSPKGDREGLRYDL
jgi:MoaA/NifB/PqqE/SkfB family radical SAM enzyme